MPGYDGTGPRGFGPGTGGGFGPCGAGRFRRAGFGRGFGRGFGMGRGMRGRGYWMYGAPEYHYADQYGYPEPSAQAEQAYLEEQLRYLESNIEEIRVRLDEISKEE